MSDASIFETLRGVQFFAGIADEHLRRLAEISQPIDFPAYKEIFHEHDPAKHVYVIIDGKVSLSICQPNLGCRQLAAVGGGELIGWSPLVGRHRLSDTARTLTETRTLAIDGAQVLDLCKNDPEFGFQFMHRASQVLAERLNATRMQLFHFGRHQLPDVQLESD